MPQILVIEDDPFVRRFYEKLFRFHNFTVEMAATGAEGIAKAKTMQPSLIFLDILMPDTNGLEVLRKLKSDPQTQNCEVIMLTNLSDQSTVQEATRAGAGGFIVKANISDEQLLAEVENRLATK